MLPPVGALTLEQFLADHPWPERMLARGRPLEWLWTFELDVTARELWPFVMDTSRFNRAMGLDRMEFHDVDGVRRGAATNGGVKQEWLEVPWDWVARRMLLSIREYSRGFAWFVRASYRLEELDGGRVRMSVYFGWIPRGAVSRLLLKLGFGPYEGKYRKVLGELEAHIRERRPQSPYRAPPPALAPEARTRLESLAAELSRRLAGRAPADLVGKLVEHIRTADDLDLSRLQVRPLARSWNADEDALLVTFLHATRLGLLDISWDVICPHCRGVRDEVPTLGDLPREAHCEICDIEFENDTERSIEITFHVHASVRDVPRVKFCSAEPAGKPHIELQIALAPGEERRVQTSLPPGVYRRRLRGEQSHHELLVSGEGPHDLAWPASRTEAGTTGPDPVVVLANDTDAPQTFVIEQVSWSDDALRPARLFNLQEFRDLFSRESLAADLKLSVGEQTILFTDMIGSTRFYEVAGDSGAFNEVRRHFAEVFEEVRAHHGAVIKTIGDAVMAAFADPLLALRAAHGIHRRFDGKRSDTPVRLRISINRGPCIAVNLNSSIDYFGRTVNLAAKLQALVEGGQIVFPRTMHAAPGVADYLTSAGATLEELELENKAIDKPVPVHRWTI
jgi:class 3 adenylate cyclase